MTRAFSGQNIIKNANLTGTKARAARRVVNRLFLISEHVFEAGRFKSFPAPTMRFDFNQCHWLGQRSARRHCRRKC